MTSDAWRAWWALTGMGQENLLGFLLFWIGSYALIHGWCGVEIAADTQSMTKSMHLHTRRFPVRGSVGFRGHRAAATLRPSSDNKL